MTLSEAIYEKIRRRKKLYSFSEMISIFSKGETPTNRKVFKSIGDLQRKGLVSVEVQRK